jgi:hypothetical protein
VTLEEKMSLATEMRRLVAAQNEPVEFAQGSYRLRLIPAAGSIHDTAFSIWEERGAQWEPIVAGWARDSGLVVAAWSPPGSPENAETLARFILAGKRISSHGLPSQGGTLACGRAVTGAIAAS